MVGKPTGDHENNTLFIDIQSTPFFDPAHRVSAPGSGARHGMGGERALQLGPFRLHAFLPTRAGQVAAGDKRRFAVLPLQARSPSDDQGPAQIHVELRQRPPPLGVVSGSVLFYTVLGQARHFAPQKKFRFKNKLLSLDATVIDLCLSLFPWAKFRRTKGAIKLHMLLDHDGYRNLWAWLDDPFEIPPGSPDWEQLPLPLRSFGQHTSFNQDNLNCESSEPVQKRL